MNTTDESAGELAPDQGTSVADLQLTRRIRQSISEDSSLSSTAKNVRVTTLEGKVTLRGVVTSDAERKVLADGARRVAGANNVDDQLVVRK